MALFVLLLLLSIPAHSQQKKRVEIKRSNYLHSVKMGEQNVRKLIGDVIIVHEGITMECDSAYEYTPTNIINAFGNVIISQDKTKLYGDELNYNGNTRSGVITGKKVIMVDEDVQLTTKEIQFNTEHNTATYRTLGVITSSHGNFSSLRGTYFSHPKIFAFGGQVAFCDSTILVNSDSLEYHSNSSTLHFFSPTRIYSDSTYLYCQGGWHNREKKESLFLSDVFIQNEGQKLIAQSVYHNQVDSLSIAKDNAVFIDSVRNSLLFSNYIEYNGKEQLALAKEVPLLVNVSEQGDSIYIRANYFAAKGIADSTGTISHRLFWGKGNVAFFRHDLQGVCDSLLFSSLDSILHMHIEPVIWNEENQLSSNYIRTHFKDEVINQMDFIEMAFVCSEEAPDKYNQIKGREMEALFKRGELYKINVTGNGETLYFLEEDGAITSLNRVESSNLTIMISDRKMQRITFRENPESNFIPVEKAETEDLFLRGFIWKAERRPASKWMVIPQWLDMERHSAIEKKALQDIHKKSNPASSIN